MRLESGMRVRCVDAALFPHPGILREGAQYEIESVVRGSIGATVKLKGLPEYTFYPDRFKPVVRVKAKCVPSLSVLLKRANASVALMSPDQQVEMWCKQRQSWVRGEMALGAAGLG